MKALITNIYIENLSDKAEKVTIRLHKNYWYTYLDQSIILAKFNIEANNSRQCCLELLIPFNTEKDMITVSKKSKSAVIITGVYVKNPLSVVVLWRKGARQ